MEPRNPRPLRVLLAAIYAVLVLLGNALHSCEPLTAATQAKDACTSLCCQSHAERAAPASDPVGWRGDRPSEDRGPDGCAACHALAQLKLGQASLAAGLPGGGDVALSRVGSDFRAPSAPMPTQAARGPPIAIASV